MSRSERNRVKGPFKPLFSTTRSLLHALIAICWGLLVLAIVAILFTGFSSYGNAGSSVMAAFLGGVSGAIAIAVVSALFIGIICLIDLRNIAAEQLHQSSVQQFSSQNNRYDQDHPSIGRSDRR